jgi:hypothetical protein
MSGVNSRRLNGSKRTLISYILVFFITILSFGWRQPLYAPLTEGWWHVYSRWLSEGLIPYKEFNLIVPPGMPYLNWFITSIIGENFLVLRYFGVFLAAVMSVLIFSMLNRVVDQTYAVILTLAGLLLFYSTEVVVMFDYNYCAIFFLVLGSFFWQKTFDEDIQKSLKRRYALLSGVVLGFSFLIKLNFVFYFILFLAFSQIVKLLANSSLIRRRETLEGLVLVGAGFITPVFSLLLYFTLNGALFPLYQSLILEAPAAKGGFPATFVNWIGYLRTSFSFRLEFATFVFFILSLYGADRVLFPALIELSRKSVERIRVTKFLSFYRIWISGFIATLGVSLFSIYLAAWHGEIGFIGTLTKQLAHLALSHSFVIPVFFTIFGFIWSVWKPDRENWQPLFILSLSLIWATGSSGGLNWYATGFASAFMIAWLTRLVNFHVYWKPVLTLYLIAIFTSLSIAWSQTPYSWWGYRTAPTFETNITSSEGLTRGLKFDRGNYFIFNRVKQEIAKARSCEGGTVVFPNMPIFQLDNDVSPAGKNGVYWFDFTSKRAVMEDLATFRENPPSSIVLLKVPQEVWNGHSNAFNAEKPFYAQKQLYSYLKSFENDSTYASKTYVLPKNGEYEPYRLGDESGYSLQVITKKSC